MTTFLRNNPLSFPPLPLVNFGLQPPSMPSSSRRVIPMSHTVSPDQLAANRANADRSTGPTTPEGKLRSSQNARKHGFTATSFAVVRLEDLNEVAALREDLIETYHPVNSQELFALARELRPRPAGHPPRRPPRSRFPLQLPRRILKLPRRIPPPEPASRRG